MVYYPHLEVLVLCRQGSNASEGARAGCWQVCSGDNKSTGMRLESNSKCKQRGRRPTAIEPPSLLYKVLSAGTKTAMSQARSARSIFLFGLLSLVQADSLGQLTVCIVEAYNLENLDANEAFGGTASDP
jgi:hypothetical protein